MKVLILGIGAQGSTVARNLEEEPNVSQVICADSNEIAVRELTCNLSKAVGVCMDAGDYHQIREVIKGCDLVVNALPLEYGKNVLEAALEEGCNYQDFAACEGIGETWEEGMEIMLTEYNERFKAIDRLALIGTGMAPGLMCVIARETVKQVDEADTILINVYEGVETRAYVPFWWSPEVALNDMIDLPVAFENGKMINTEPFALPIKRKYDYLDKEISLVEHAHDEPYYIGRNSKTHFRNVKNVHFKYGGTGINLGQDLFKEGKLSREPEIVNGREIIPNEEIIKNLPNPPRSPKEIKSIIDQGVITDKGAMVCEVTGSRDGKRILVECHVHAPGLTEAFERCGLSHEQYVTGNCGFLFTRLFVRGMIEEKGLISSDMLSDMENEQYLKWAEELNITSETIIKY